MVHECLNVLAEVIKDTVTPAATTLTALITTTANGGNANTTLTPSHEDDTVTTPRVSKKAKTTFMNIGALSFPRVNMYVGGSVILYSSHCTLTKSIPQCGRGGKVK